MDFSLQLRIVLESQLFGGQWGHKLNPFAKVGFSRACPPPPAGEHKVQIAELKTETERALKNKLEEHREKEADLKRDKRDLKKERDGQATLSLPHRLETNTTPARRGLTPWGQMFSHPEVQELSAKKTLFSCIRYNGK